MSEPSQAAINLYREIGPISDTDETLAIIDRYLQAAELKAKQEEQNRLKEAFVMFIKTYGS